MSKGHKNIDIQNLPACAVEFIKLIIKKMRYRRKVRQDVQAELTAHFEDELKDCAGDQEKEQKAQQLITEFGDVKLLAVLLRRAKKRCRPLWRTVVARTFQAAAIVIGCFILYLVWFFTGKPVITVNYVAELNRMVRPVADESLNAAPFYNEAASRFEKLSEDNIDIFKLLSKKPNEVTTEQKQLIANWLSENEETLELIITGTQKPYYWRKYSNRQNTSEMMAVLVPHLSEFRKLAFSLRWRTYLSAEKGRYEEAFDDIKSCYHLGQHLRGDKFIIEQLVGIAIEAISVQTIRDIISQYQIDYATLTNLQKDFEQMIASEDFVISLKAERMATYDVIQRTFTDGLGDGHVIPRQIKWLYPQVQVIAALPTRSSTAACYQEQRPNWLSQLVSNVRHEICEPGGFIYESVSFVKKSCYILFTHPNKQQTKEMADQLYSYWDKVFHKTPGQIRAEGIDTHKQTMEIIKGNLLLEILAPALGRINVISYRNKTEIQATLTTLAILRYRQDKDAYPDNLKELVTSGYLKELPMDSFSDKPLVYRRTDDSFILYSLGENFTDNGGQLGKDTKGRPKLWTTNGDAVFWPVPKTEVNQ